MCILLGDFNKVLSPTERLNCSIFSPSMQLFADFIHSSNLIESPLQGRFFTWQNSVSKSKIDRCFVSADILVAWPNYFESFVATSWANIKATVIGDLVCTLRELRVQIKGWNHQVFGNLNNNLEGIHQSIHELDSAADISDLSELDRERLSSLQSESYRVSKQLESLWHQKSREQVFLFYKKLYNMNSGVPFSLDSLPLHCLYDSHSLALVAPFFRRGDFSNSKEFTGAFPPGINTAFLVLIPKVQGASNISDFRPISLINGIFNLIPKVLANRLSPLLPQLVSENQFGFIRGRNIHDWHIIASEIIHIASRRKEKLLRLLIQSVLINGSPTKNFSMGKGVRQGDPLSPMLFVLAVEGLKAMISKAVGLGLFDGVQIDGYVDPVSILQFADDTLLFIPQDFDMLRNLLRKSSILGINVADKSLATASVILNCSVEKFPITYLGLPLSTRPIKASLWKPVVSRFSDQLDLWKESEPSMQMVMEASVEGKFSMEFIIFEIKIQIFGLFFSEGVSVKIGNGYGIYFWQDTWSGSSPLAVRFPGLFALSREKIVTVNEQRQWSASTPQFQFNWNHRLRIGEQQLLQDLEMEVSNVSMDANRNDVFYWKGKINAFKSRNISFILQQKIGVHGIFLNLRDSNLIPALWKWKILPRIQFFSWLLINDRIFSNASLVARGIIDPSLIGCLVCNLEESNMHIIFHCRFAWKFWCFILSKCDIFWVSPASVSQFFILWTSYSHPSFKDLWRLIWFFGIWELWISRNNRVFNGMESSHESLAYLCIGKAVHFCSSFHPQFLYSGNDVSSMAIGVIGAQFLEDCVWFDFVLCSRASILYYGSPSSKHSWKAMFLSRAVVVVRSRPSFIGNVGYVVSLCKTLISKFLCNDFQKSNGPGYHCLHMCYVRVYLGTTAAHRIRIMSFACSLWGFLSFQPSGLSGFLYDSITRLEYQSSYDMKMLSKSYD
ncbi:uncharacterized protein LOC126670164 [Mercurialis annua]|uniref:uncharacterized protein LOC126670164 n=1 Tax=Mercurialis annua TaxID=3986 RepID=UPI0024AE9B86|nr:uncharacterized protein LOC126670164 [Mercurialis annua]